MGGYLADLANGAYSSRSSTPSGSGVYSNASSSPNRSTGSSRAPSSSWTRKTKLVCTIGPATSSKAEFWKLADAGEGPGAHILHMARQFAAMTVEENAAVLNWYCLGVH